MPSCGFFAHSIWQASWCRCSHSWSFLSWWGEISPLLPGSSPSLPWPVQNCNWMRLHWKNSSVCDVCLEGEGREERERERESWVSYVHIRRLVQLTCLDGIEVHQDIFKLLQEKETWSHTLAAGNGVCNWQKLHLVSSINYRQHHLPHSLPELPTSWKYCWASFKFSCYIFRPNKNTSNQLALCQPVCTVWL